jgi:hypothetical protein
VSDFGPWLFATALVLGAAHIFVQVPNSRKWFGYSFATVIVFMGGLAVYSLLPDSLRQWSSTNVAGPWLKYQSPQTPAENPYMKFKKNSQNDGNSADGPIGPVILVPSGTK